MAVFSWEGNLAVVYLPTKTPVDDIMRLKHIKENTFKRIRKNGELGETFVFDIDSNGSVTQLIRHNNYYPKIK